MTKLIYGVGINDRLHPTKVSGKDTKEHSLWRGFLQRCYSLNSREKYSSYIGCSVSENFKHYAYFYEWCQNQIGFGQSDFELDKDLLFKCNRIYSEDTCVFIPKRLNTLFGSNKSCRGSLPIGVSPHQGKFLARCSRGLTSDYIGIFNTSEEAFQAYKQAKEVFIKLQADKWKDLLDPRAYQALMVYEVSSLD